VLPSFWMIELRGYIDESGNKRFAQWLEGLDAAAAAKVTIALARMELGNFSKVKGVGSGVFEYKIDFGPGYRIYFGKDGDRLVILIGGGTKKRQRTGHRGGARMLGRLQTKEETGDSIMPLTHDFKETIRARRSAIRNSVKRFCARPSSASSMATWRPARRSCATMSTPLRDSRTSRSARRYPPRA